MLKIKLNGSSDLSLSKKPPTKPVLTVQDFRKHGFIPKPGASLTNVAYVYGQYCVRGFQMKYGKKAVEQKHRDQGATCAECREKVPLNQVKWWWIKPLKEAGDPVPENLQLVCKPCFDKRDAARGAGPKSVKRPGNFHPKPATDIQMFNKGGFVPRADLSFSENKAKYTQFMRNRLTQTKSMVLPQLYFNQNGRCAMCEKHYDGQDMTVDHLVPIDKGGTSDITNLQLMCETCNKHKSNMNVVEKVRNADGTISVTLKH